MNYLTLAILAGAAIVVLFFFVVIGVIEEINDIDE